MLLALAAGLAIPGLLGLINQEIGARSRGPRGRTGAIVALTCVVIIWGVRDYQHRRAVTALNSLLYHQAEPTRVAAYPYMVTPFRWHGVVETRTSSKLCPSIRQRPMSTCWRAFCITSRLRLHSLRRRRLLISDASISTGRFPFTRQSTLNDGAEYLVDFQDLRYTYPGSRNAVLGGFVLLDHDHVIDEGMNSSRPPALENLEHAPGQR